jgi:pimeloyl-ACP methyl ester carboxylesterase
MPRTSAQVARELHALLAAAGEKPPYLLVGYSLAGFNIRVYNGMYSSEVAGMVLVDASHEDQLRRMPPSIAAYNNKMQAAARWQAILVPALIDLGIARLTSDVSRPAFLPRDLREEFRYLQLQTKFTNATASEIKSFDISADEVRASGDLGNKPLIVLTAGKIPDASALPPGFPVKDFADFEATIWQNDLQVREAHLSTQAGRSSFRTVTT